MSPTLLALGAAMTLAVAGPAAAAAPDPLGPHRGRDRVLVMSALDPHDAKLLRQRDVFRQMGQGARERDLVLLEAVGASPQATTLRDAVGIAGDGFEAVLVGKDGGVKLRSGNVLGQDRLFPTIDAMPMRQNEMQRRQP